MRFIITGIDTQGHSTVIREETVEEDYATLWSTNEAPPHITRSKEMPAVDPKCGPGETSWRRLVLKPDASFGMHRTNTLDYDTVISGDGILLLESGEVQLSPGDCVLLPDVVHGWRAGSQGMTMSIVLIGLNAD